MGSRRIRLAVWLLLLTACHGGAGDASVARPTTPSATSTTTAAPIVSEPTVPPPATTVSCPATPHRAQPDPNRPRYKLTVDVRVDQNLVVGTTDVHFVPDLDTDRLVFRLWPNGPRPAETGGGIDTEGVVVDGRPVAASLPDPTTLVVQPGGTLRRGAPLDAHLGWTLRLPNASHDRISRDGDSVRLGSFFPILPWEPGVGWDLDPPTGAFAEASTAPVADYDLTVTVPDGFSVLASGVNDGPGHWTATAMRDVALSVGRFATATGTATAPDPVPVTVGVAQGIGETPETYLAEVLAVLADFGRRFGPYPWPEYTLAITPAVGGGIEYPGHVMQSPGTTGVVTSHEIAHQWFYALVGNDQGRDPWLDEGLASWGEARYENTLSQFTTAVIPPGAAGELGQPMTYWSARPNVYDLGVYVQGVQALAALGPPDVVDCALRVYAAVFAYRIARQADLVAALRATFPDAATVLARFGVIA